MKIIFRTKYWEWFFNVTHKINVIDAVTKLFFAIFFLASPKLNNYNSNITKLYYVKTNYFKFSSILSKKKNVSKSLIKMMNNTQERQSYSYLNFCKIKHTLINFRLKVYSRTTIFNLLQSFFWLLQKYSEIKKIPQFWNLVPENNKNVPTYCLL